MKLKPYLLFRLVAFLAAAAFVIALLATAHPASAQTSTQAVTAVTAVQLDYNTLQRQFGYLNTRKTDLVFRQADKQYEVMSQWYLEFPHGPDMRTQVSIPKKEWGVLNPLGLAWKDGQLQTLEPIYFGEDDAQVIMPGEKLVATKLFRPATEFDWTGGRDLYHGDPLDTKGIQVYDNLVTTSYYDDTHQTIYTFDLYPQDNGTTVTVDLIHGRMTAIILSDRKFAFERGLMAGNSLDTAGIIKDGDLVKITDIMWTYYPLFIKDGQESAWKVNKGKLSAVQLRKVSGEGGLLVHTADTPSIPSLQRYSVSYSGYQAPNRQGCERTSPRTSCHTQFVPRPEDIGTDFKVFHNQPGSYLLEETSDTSAN